MNRRLSILGNLEILSLAYSAVLEVGDSHLIAPYSRALAIQREHEIFYGSEGHFNYPIFSTTIPRPIISEKILINRSNLSSQIHVNTVSVIGASFSSVIQIGSTNHIYGDSRVKHIRHLRDDEEES